MTDKFIKLNVGGTIFETTKETLSKSGYFTALFSGKWTYNENEPYKIDRSSKLFEHVLCYLRDPRYQYPSKYVSELKYYLIKYQAEDFRYDFFSCGKDKEEFLNNIMNDCSILISQYKYKMGVCMILGCRNIQVSNSSLCKDHQ